MAITVMEVLKRLPRTNCGDCGRPTCLAFATQVIKEGEDLGKCPHLVAGEEFGELIRAQQQAGVGRRRESAAISLEVLQAKVAPLNFAALAAGLGAGYGEEASRPYLTLPYFGNCLQVFKDELRYPPGALADPWDAILLYNYIASAGNREPTGDWIAYNSLPNSVSKAKTLTRLERELAARFSGRASHLKERATLLGAAMVSVGGEDADVQAVFQPLPRVPILLLFWDADPAEGFEAQGRLLFDATVADYLDLEALLFLVEHLLARLMG
ncbi:MAG: DUF3786 domain-containing protein [Deltaproteobacteria bacterium]|nr:DUF3786 domain-containing protein [Deltaproteobacteria bacterium]